MVVLVVISGNKLILGMSLIKMLKWIQVLIPGVLHKNSRDFIYFLLNVSCHANNLRTTCCLYLIEQVYVVTNHDLHYQRLWKDREEQVRRFYLCQ